MAISNAKLKMGELSATEDTLLMALSGLLSNYLLAMGVSA